MPCVLSCVHNTQKMLRSKKSAKEYLDAKPRLLHSIISQLKNGEKVDANEIIDILMETNLITTNIDWIERNLETKKALREQTAVIFLIYAYLHGNLSFEEFNAKPVVGIRVLLRDFDNRDGVQQQVKAKSQKWETERQELIEAVIQTTSVRQPPQNFLIGPTLFSKEKHGTIFCVEVPLAIFQKYDFSEEQRPVIMLRNPLNSTRIEFTSVCGFNEQELGNNTIKMSDALHLRLGEPANIDYAECIDLLDIDLISNLTIRVAHTMSTMSDEELTELIQADLSGAVVLYQGQTFGNTMITNITLQNGEKSPVGRLGPAGTTSVIRIDFTRDKSIGPIQCRVCARAEADAVPLYHCSHCMDAIYCGVSCQAADARRHECTRGARGARDALRASRRLPRGPL